MRWAIAIVLLSGASALAQRTINTVAGGQIQNGVPASGIDLTAIGGITEDQDGNLYFADPARYRIRKIDSNGIVRTVAGNGISSVTGDGGPAAAASLVSASGIVANTSGNLFFLDSNRVRRIDASGNITTIAGTGIPGSLGSDGPAVFAQIDFSASLALGHDGALYFTEPEDVRKVTPDGHVVLVAGAPQPIGVFLSDGDGGPAVAAHLNQPYALATDGLGNTYIVEQQQTIRLVAPDGTISTIAGDGQFRTGPAPGDGGPAKNAGFTYIGALATDAQGALFIGDGAISNFFPICRIRRIGPDGMINTIAGGPSTAFTADGPAASVRLSSAGSLFVDAKGYIYFVDSNPTRIRRITPQSTVETIAGASPLAAPDGPDARQAWLVNPTAIAVDPGGNLYIAESGCLVRKISPDGALTTVAGSSHCLGDVQEGPVATTDLPYLYDLAVTSQGLIYASDYFGDLLSITPGKTIATVPGVERPAGSTFVDPPLRLAVDSQDRVYVLPVPGQFVKRVSPGGNVETFIGPTGATVSLFLSTSSALAVDPSDNVYVLSANGGIGTVYRITQDGNISAQTFGGFPDSLAVDAAGSLYGTDFSLQMLGFSYSRLPLVQGFGGDAGPLLSAELSGPARLIRAPSGAFYFIDTNNQRVRKISGSPPSQPPTLFAAGVVNAASGTVGAVAPGQLISVYGTNLGPASGWVNTPENNIVPSSAGYTRLLFDSGPAPILAVTANQVNAFVPYDLSPGKTTAVQVEVDGIVSPAVNISVVDSAFGLFTADGSGAGQGAILNQDASYNSPSHPAERGSIVSLYGTGEGLSTPLPLDGALTLSTPYPAPDAPVTVTIGGQSAEVLYAGAAPFLVSGVLQINARIPDVAAGAAPVVVSVGGLSTTKVVTVRSNKPMRILALLLLSSASMYGADDLLVWMDAIAQKQLDQRAAAIAQVHTPEQARQRQAFVRSKILELIGGLPDYSGPLHAMTTGRVDQPGFVIEKVLFQSLPGLYVTANLYRPDKPGRFPAVLLPLGHWDYGKPAVQRIAGNLALKGFVVLVYDPIGQGERQQAYDRRIGASLVGGSTEQHFLAGAKDILIGKSFARDRIFDGMRAIDYLVTRPEVDKDRIGATGCSGGGTLSTYISALDPRIKVAAPTCYMTSFRELFAGAVGDSEQSITGFISNGFDLVDYVELFAPKPWLIGSTEQDFFPLAGAKSAYVEAQRWYRMFGAEDHVKWVVGPGGHGTPLVVREAIYDWMIRWLNNGEGSAKEQDVPLLPEFKLWVTETGQVSDLRASRDIYDVIRERFEKEKIHGSKEELSQALREWMADPGFDAVVHETFTPPQQNGRRPTVLLVDTRQTPNLLEKARDLAQRGYVVEILLPRGEPADPDPGRAFSGAWIMNTRASLIGLNLPGMRAHDIVKAVSALAARDDVDPSNIRAEAQGIAGIWLLMAAAADSRIKSVALYSTPASLRAAIEEPLARDLHDAVIPGFALKWDLSDLVALIRPRNVTWTDPTDWMHHVKQLPGDYVYTPAEQ